MNKKKLMSLILALVMLVGAFAPFTALAEGEEKTTESVTVHKILTTKTNWDFDGKKVTITPKDGEPTSKVIKVKDNKYYEVTFDNDGKLKETEIAESADFVKALKNEKLDEGKSALIEDVKFEGQIGIDGTKYDGTQIGNIGKYFGTGSEEIEGVFFALKFGEGQEAFVEPKVDKTANAEAVAYTNGETIDGTVTQNAPKAPASVDHTYYVKAKGTEGNDKLTPMTVNYKTKVDGKEVTKTYLVATKNIDEAVGGKTTSTGLKLITKGLKGAFEIDEIHEKSSYKGKAFFDEKGNTLTFKDSKYYQKDGTEYNGKVITKEANQLTDMKAVPVKITLPLVNDTGVVKEAHVYPKNIENKPEIDKNFKIDNDLKEQKKDNFDLSTETKDGANKVVSPTAGAQYENYKKEKSLVSAEIGKEIPYEVKTKIPAQSKLATAYWTDEMTEGLTFDQDSVKITIGGESAATTDYTLDTTENGFMLRLTKDGLAKVNNKAEDVEVVLHYTAKVNGNVKPDATDKNKVVFNYGNNPSKGNTPEPNKPNDNGELKVTKTWDDKTWADGEKATFVLIDKETGKRVTADDLVRPQGMSDENWAKAKAEFKNEVEIGYKDANKEYTWKYLNKNKEYKAVEVKISSGTEAEYTVETDAQGTKIAGEIKVKNHKSDNPTPLEPTSPEVVTYGKKFVKTNQEGTERLAGAEFYVKNAEGKYLVAKTSAEQNAANIDVKAKKDALDKAVKEYNDLSADDQKGQAGTTAKAAIDKAQDEYNKAFKKAAQGYKWEEKSTNALVLVSDSEGRFEITGLDKGEYKLEEKTPPKGFAKLTGDIDFTVGKGSYAGEVLKKNTTDKYEAAEGHITYNKDNAANKYGLQVKNKKVDIPQTGGIGTVIFTVVGIALMAGAFVAMRKRTAEEN